MLEAARCALDSLAQVNCHSTHLLDLLRNADHEDTPHQPFISSTWKLRSFIVGRENGSGFKRTRRQASCAAVHSS